jgi:hypothetical protein
MDGGVLVAFAFTRSGGGGEAAGEGPAQASGRRMARCRLQRIGRRAHRFVLGESAICKRN